MEFTKGKWYKNTWGGSHYYIKVTKTTQETGYIRIYYSDKGWTSGIHSESSYIANESMEKSMLQNGIIPLSEIQQYLPAGHVDLIKNIKKSDRVTGEYYYHSFRYENSRGEIIVKWDAISQERNKAIKLHTDTYIKSSCCTSNLGGNDVFRLATPQEKQWLNACIKADKFIPLEDVKMNKRKVVHCKTQEEWNFVINKKYKDTTVTSETYRDSYYNNHRGQQCLDIKNKQHSSKDYFITQGYQILIFQEWLDENNYNNNKPISINKKSKNNEGQSIKIKRIVSNVSRGVRPGGTGFFNRRSVTTSRCRSNSYEKRAIEC